jgi:hypothetical protein
VLFTALDPEEFALCFGWPQLSRVGAYSLGFFLLWLVTSLSSWLTCYFLRPCEGPRAPQG